MTKDMRHKIIYFPIRRYAFNGYTFGGIISSEKTKHSTGGIVRRVTAHVS
jgi:hypothetical protein